MGVFILVLSFSISLINLSFATLSIPGENLDKQTLTSLGIKTIGWQGEEENENPSQVHVHHNYSKVTVQKQQTDDYYQSPTSFGGQQQIDLDQSQLGQTAVNENDYSELLGQYEDQGNSYTQNNLDQSNTFDQISTNSKLNQNQQVTFDGQQEYHEYDEFPSSYNNEQIYNAHGYGEMLNLDQIIEAEHNLQNQQTYEDFPEYDTSNLQLVDQTAEATNVQPQERQVKKFYTLNEPIYIHGFKYPPDPKDVYPLNQQKPAIQPETYSKCPKMATGQFVHSLSCNQFLNCWKGRGFVQNCAPGTLFNPKTLECDFASKVQCITGPRKPEETQISKSNQKLEISCPSGFSGVIPHYSDCSKFINCANGIENVMDCPPGTLFSLKINNCDFPYKAECASWSVQFGNIDYNTYSSQPKAEDSNHFIISESYQGQGNSKNNQQNNYHLGGYNNKHDQKYVSTDDFRYHQGHGSNIGYNQSQVVHGYGSVKPETNLQQNLNGYNQGSLQETTQTFGVGQSSTGQNFNQGVLHSHQTNYGYHQYPQNQHNVHSHNQGSLHEMTQTLGAGQSTISENSNQGFLYSHQDNYGHHRQNGHGYNQGSSQGTLQSHLHGVSQSSDQDLLHSQQNNYGYHQQNVHGYNQGSSQGTLQSHLHGVGQSSGQDHLYSQQNNYGYHQQQTPHGYNQGSLTSSTHLFGQVDQSGDFNQGHLHTNQNNYGQEQHAQNHLGGGYLNVNEHHQGLGPQDGLLQQSHGKGYYEQNQQLSQSYNQKLDTGKSGLSNNQQIYGNQNRYIQGQQLHGNTDQQLSGQQSNEFQHGSSNTLGGSGKFGSIKCPPGATGLFPHPFDCSKFLNCANGGTSIQDCGPGTVFNPESQVCDFPYKVKCQNSKNNQENTGSHDHYTDSATNRWQTGKSLYDLTLENQQQQSGGKQTTHSSVVYQQPLNQKQDSSKAAFINQGSLPHGGILHSPNTDAQVIVKCPSQADGLYPHPTICSKFLNCANGQTFIQDCGPGTVFNPTSKVCDYPHNVDCGSSHGEGIIDVRTVPVEFKPSVTQQTFYDHTQGSNSGNTIQKGSHGYGSQDSLGYYDQTGHYGSTSNKQNVHGSNIEQGNQKVHGEGTVLQAQESYGQRQDSFTSQNQDRWVNKTYYGSYDSNTNNKQQGSFGYGKVNKTVTVSTHLNTYNQNKPSNSNDQDTQENKNIFYGQNLNKTYQHHIPSSFPITDLNADYEFGNEDVTLEAGPAEHKPKIPTTIRTNRKRKDFCEPLDFHCSVDDCIPQSMVCDGVKDCPSGVDEEKCERYLDEFTSVTNSILAVREKERYFNISLIYCAKSCLESKGFHCRSFSYRRDDAACFLSDSNVGLSGSLISSHPYNYYEVKALSVNCTNLYKCPNHKCISYKKVCDGINDCSDRSDEKGCNAKAFGYEIKLSGTDKKHEGRIEIKAFGKSGYVCDDKFGLRDADVVCRELGFPLGALEVKSNSYYAQDLNDKDVLYLMDDVACLGNETTLRDCDFNGWGVSNCEPQEVVGVVCKTPLETCPKDTWKCNTAQECIPIGFLCDEVFDCTDQSDESEILCEQPIQIRLVNGKSKSEGRIEIRYHGIWGTVCDDDFNDDSAKVVCKQLGYPGKATAKKDGHFGAGTGPIWLDQVFCQGNESGIQHCVHWNWGEHNCEHAEDVGVVCNNALELEEFGSERNTKMEPRFNDALPDYLFPERCGLRKDDQFLENDDVHFRVIKGSNAKKGDYPWQASLRIKGKTKPTHWCGAVVISQRFVLTAAHCLEGFSKGSYVVVAGDYHTDDVEGTEQEAYIDEFYIHEEFRKGQKMNNDIALVQLKGNGFLFTKDIQPICLPDSDLKYEKGLNCTISGFGSIQSGKSGYSHQLRAGWIPLQSKDVCQMPHVYGSAITDGMICAGSLDEGIDACDGDSGGPLACLHNGYFTLYGLTSWGQHCGHANKPGVYVKVSHYRKWIDEVMKKQVQKLM